MSNTITRAEDAMRDADGRMTDDAGGVRDGIALKEWASAIEALAAGRQIILMRKGGIAEETREFRLEAPRFWLLPTYEHQREHLLKAEERPLIARTQAERAAAGGALLIKAWAEAMRDLEVTDAETLARLDRFHIWTGAFAEERLRWKRTKPLHVLVLRVHVLEEPVRIPHRESYAGCKSWVRLEDVPGDVRFRPALSDGEFRRLEAEILNALGLAAE
ncbi:DUF1802 family protein [Thermobacillus sp. ZCTH02-B1]|uniref:DUF1802 family protein n=1 Tax=Thermobacillus sp. ZCTH02-B1 TaxID=1858795 RepID=UPI0025E659D0|nr:DUF1802 family protein [Thermobacillus sp. ZCTH02-B1]